eukprot:PITA_31640
MNSIRLILSLATSFKWEVHQMDVKSTFLHGDLHEEIYMVQPARFIQTDSSLVCQLKESLYGLKKAPSAWTYSGEAEYCGVVEASKEALWLHHILLEFGFQQQHPTALWCDNQSAIRLWKDPVQHQHKKRIELHMHLIRKLIHDHVLEVQYCSIDDQHADIFTKALIEVKFTKI